MCCFVSDLPISECQASMAFPTAARPFLASFLLAGLRMYALCQLSCLLCRWNYHRG